MTPVTPGRRLVYVSLVACQLRLNSDIEIYQITSKMAYYRFRGSRVKLHCAVREEINAI